MLMLLEDLYSQLSSEEFKWSNFQIKELRSIKCSPAVRIRLDDLLDDLEYAPKKLLSAHRSLKAFCDKEPGIKSTWAIYKVFMDRFVVPLPYSVKSETGILT